MLNEVLRLLNGERLPKYKVIQTVYMGGVGVVAKNLTKLEAEKILNNLVDPMSEHFDAYSEYSIEKED